MSSGLEKSAFSEVDHLQMNGKAYRKCPCRRTPRRARRRQSVSRESILATTPVLVTIARGVTLLPVWEGHIRQDHLS